MSRTEIGVNSYVVSRFYRAPEIILGIKFDSKVDVWAFGCCLFEMVTGKILFDGRDNREMLRKIIEVKGKMSEKIYRRGEFWENYFNKGLFISVRRDSDGKEEFKEVDFSFEGIGVKSFMSEFEMNEEMNNFVNLVEKCTHLDPFKRLSAKEALEHTFFK